MSWDQSTSQTQTLQLIASPPTTLHQHTSARESLSLLRHRALGLPPPPSSSTTSALSHSASLRLRQAQRDEAEEREGQRRLAGWGVDAQALCAEVGALLGRCDPALWLLPRRGVAEEAMGGVVLVALVLAQVCMCVCTRWFLHQQKAFGLVICHVVD